MKSLGIKNKIVILTIHLLVKGEDETLGFSVYDKASGIGYAKQIMELKVMWSCANNNVMIMLVD